VIKIDGLRHVGGDKMGR